VAWSALHRNAGDCREPEPCSESALRFLDACESRRSIAAGPATGDGEDDVTHPRHRDKLHPAARLAQVLILRAGRDDRDIGSRRRSDDSAGLRRTFARRMQAIPASRRYLRQRPACFARAVAGTLEDDDAQCLPVSEGVHRPALKQRSQPA
jgi:hypothetical protein